MNHFPGEALRKRREALGLSLQDMHARIHVPISYLDAFERGGLDRLPVPAYAIGFLQSYCQALGLDAEPFVDRYRLCRHCGGHEIEESLRQRVTLALREPARRPAWLEEVFAWGTICAILLMGWIAYSVITRPFAEQAGARVDAGVKEVAPPPFDVDYPNP